MSRVQQERCCPNRQRRLLDVTMTSNRLRIELSVIKDEIRESSIIPMDGLLLLAYLEQDYPIIDEIREYHPNVYRKLGRLAETIANTVGVIRFDQRMLSDHQLMDSFMLKNMPRVVF